MDIYASNWDETDANNDDAAPDGWGEGMAPSGVNNSARAMMGATKRYVNQQIPKVTAGTTTAYTLSYTVAPGALIDGMTHRVQFNATCGASPTLNVNSLGAKPIHYFNGAAWAVVPSGMIKTDQIVKVAYNSSAGTYRIVASAAPIVAQSSAAQSYTTLPGAIPFYIETGDQIIGAGGTGTINFVAPFTVAPVPVITAAGNSGTLSAAPWVFAVSSTQLAITNTGANSINFKYIAIGP